MLRYAISLSLLLLTMALGCGGGAANPPTYPPPPPGADSAAPRDAKATRPAPPPMDEQKQMSPREELDQTMAELTKRLALKPAQVVPVRRILGQDQARRAQIISAQASTSNVNEMIRLFEVQHKSEMQTQNELSKVLSGDQIDAYRKWVKENRKRLEAMGVKPKALPQVRPPSGMGTGRPGGF
ncbi:MAG: hypothetical protein KQH53_07290 [Desulfarculaceae bacterium]|nr:hypothetical protein [Desulfarculaceae bacterium]